MECYSKTYYIILSGFRILNNYIFPIILSSFQDYSKNKSPITTP